MKNNIDFLAINPVDDLTAISHKFLSAANKQKFDEKSLIETTQRLANILNKHHLIYETIYPIYVQNIHVDKWIGLKDGKGNILKFKLWENDFAFHLLNSFFRAWKIEGVMITNRKLEKEFTVTISSGNTEKVLEYFSTILQLLEDELQYRKMLKAQIQFDKLISELTTKYRPNNGHHL